MDDIERLASAASRRGIRVALAESLTSGLLASRVGRGEDAATWFAGSIVAYLTDVKEGLLGLEPGTDPCSPECAEQLAGGARSLLTADIAVSTTGVGGPDPEDGHAPGTVYLGWATADTTGHRLLRLDGGPQQVLDDTVSAAVALLADLVEQGG
ncbi:CinA family protein [Microbacterium horticulturae]|uniref:CinA family protein n=1 Tax=Microbacterium horticulturae TaxID=3028316 RepID=A0ABY8BX50_9MICO|nr:CinA family protein [Microbacterium sp. KACC 23027]WEG08771.1 CinA family protein [Microbacterium sp. KACC 23027]